jgi:hypothetical protein
MGVPLVFGCIEKCDWAFASLAAQFVEGIGMPRELGAIAMTELRPTIRVMTEPGPEATAWSDLAVPLVDLGFRLGDSAGPKPVDQDSSSVFARSGLIYALEFYILRRNSVTHG